MDERGKPIERRAFLAMSASASASYALGCGDNRSGDLDCPPTPEQTAGPFYFDPGLERGAISEGRDGVALTLSLRIVSAIDCSLVSGAVVDLWHSDAGGLYSGYSNQGDDRDIDTSGETFCRGVQVTDPSGQVVFTSVFPGWYPGRTVHYHFKVRAMIGEDIIESTGQIYFPDAITARVSSVTPYAARGAPPITNATDSIAGDPAADGTLAELQADGDGYRAALTIGVAS